MKYTDVVQISKAASYKAIRKVASLIKKASPASEGINLPKVRVQHPRNTKAGPGRTLKYNKKRDIREHQKSVEARNQQSRASGQVDSKKSVARFKLNEQARIGRLRAYEDTPVKWYNPTSWNLLRDSWQDADWADRAAAINAKGGLVDKFVGVINSKGSDAYKNASNFINAAGALNFITRARGYGMNPHWRISRRQLQHGQYPRAWNQFDATQKKLYHDLIKLYHTDSNLSATPEARQATQNALDLAKVKKPSMRQGAMPPQGTAAV